NGLLAPRRARHGRLSRPLPALPHGHGPLDSHGQGGHRPPPHPRLPFGLSSPSRPEERGHGSPGRSRPPAPARTRTRPRRHAQGPSPAHPATLEAAPPPAQGARPRGLAARADVGRRASVAGAVMRP